MKKIIFLVTFIIFILGFATFYLLNSLPSLLDKCVYYKKETDNILFVGKSVKFSEQDNWIVNKISLCDTGFINIFSIKVFTPKSDSTTIIGREGDTNGEKGYRWLGLPMAKLNSVLNKNNLTVIFPEKTTSREQIIESFKDPEGPTCKDIRSCTDRLDFLETRGRAQSDFLDKLKKKETLSLFLDFITGKAQVLSGQFGIVNSLDTFMKLANDRII